MCYEMSQLRGISYPLAEMYGKPHFMAHYLSDNPTPASVDKYALDDDAVCICCGKRATNVHHTPPKGVMRVFNLATPKGMFKLRPALVAVCGTGNSGCHGDIHLKLIDIEWIWDEKGFLSGWWDGSILGFSKPHNPELYSVGYWRITNHETNSVRMVRL